MNTFQNLCIAFLISISSQSFAKSLASTDKVDSASETFMKQILMSETSAAYNLISAYVGVNLEQFMQRGEKAAQDMATVKNGAGEPLSYALLKKQNIDEHFYKLTYLLKYRSAAIIWELNYYQADKGWHLVDVSFNGDINSLFR